MKNLLLKITDIAERIGKTEWVNGNLQRFYIKQLRFS